MSIFTHNNHSFINYLLTLPFESIISLRKITAIHFIALTKYHYVRENQC